MERSGFQRSVDIHQAAEVASVAESLLWFAVVGTYPFKELGDDTRCCDRSGTFAAQREQSFDGVGPGRLGWRQTSPQLWPDNVGRRSMIAALQCRYDLQAAMPVIIDVLAKNL